jgi:hypothetical protein
MDFGRSNVLPDEDKVSWLSHSRENASEYLPDCRLSPGTGPTMQIFSEDWNFQEVFWDGIIGEAARLLCAMLSTWYRKEHYR